MKFTAFLFFDGDCEDAFTFYHATLGGKITAMERYEGSPDEHNVPAAWKRKIRNACLEIDGNILMGSDAPPDRTEPRQGGYAVSLQVDDIAEAKRVLAALSQGGTVTTPFAESAPSKGFGACKDKFGVAWMVAC